MRNKLLIFAAALILCLTLLSGCGSGEAEGTDTASEYEPVTVENYGRTITVKKMPEKIVTAGPNCTEVMCQLGLADKVVGDSVNNHSRGPLKQWEKDYESIPEINNGYPTLENVIGSGCDFLYAIDWVFEGDFTIDALEKAGITVYVCEATDYDGVWKELTDLGNIFGKRKEARSFISSEKKKIASVEDAVKDQEPLKVFVFDSDCGDGTIYTAGGPNIETTFIETAAGENIYADQDKAWFPVSYEDVYNADPDFIIIHDYFDASYEDNVKALKKDPLLSQLDAVKNDRFMKLSLESAFPGSRTSYTVEKMAGAMWPDKF